MHLGLLGTGGQQVGRGSDSCHVVRRMCCKPGADYLACQARTVGMHVCHVWCFGQADWSLLGSMQYQSQFFFHVTRAADGLAGWLISW
jgi:hypothetical protein